MRILLFGMRCRFTTEVLQALTDGGHDVAALVLPGYRPDRAWTWVRPPGSPRGLPLASPPTVDAIAARTGLPVAEIRFPLSSDAEAAIRAFNPQLILVACFPRLIPDAVLQLAPLGGYNLHPSFLPELRGPDPLFWTLHQGLQRSGVTLHRLSNRFDAGEILAQRSVEIPLGVRIDELETVMGRMGGALLVDSLAQWSDLTPRARPQIERLATMVSNPLSTDFRVDTSWPVERAYRFIRGVFPIGQDVELFDETGEIRRVRDAERFGADTDGWPAIKTDNRIADIVFADGVLRVISAESGR